jgi:hypothetical protein
MVEGFERQHEQAAWRDDRRLAQSERRRMRGGSTISALLLSLSLASWLWAASGAVGQLLDVQGRVEIRHGRGAVKVGGLLTELQTGDIARVVRGRAVLVLFANGARFALSAGSAARVGPSALQRLAGPLPRALSPAAQPFAQPLAVARRPIPQKLLGVITRGEDPTLGPRHLSPHGAVRQPPVTLRWEGPIEGEQVVLQVSDGDHVVYRVSLPATARSHELPAGAVKPGPWYGWVVTAVQSGESGHRGHALLRLLTPEERQALAQEESRAAASESGGADEPVWTMRRAELDERLGLFDEARALYLQVRRLRPEDAAVREALSRLQSVSPQ